MPTQNTTRRQSQSSTPIGTQSPQITKQETGVSGGDRISYTDGVQPTETPFGSTARVSSQSDQQQMFTGTPTFDPSQQTQMIPQIVNFDQQDGQTVQDGNLQQQILDQSSSASIAASNAWWAKV